VTDDRHKDIVKEVFSKSTKADDRISSLFTRLENPQQVSLENDQISPPDFNESPAAKEAGLQFASKRTIKNKKSIHPAGMVVVAAILVSAFFVGGYLRQPGNVSAKMSQQTQSVNSSEPVSPLQKQPLVDVQPGSVSAKFIQNSTPLDWQHVINWGRLLGQISATIPKTVQLSVLETGDGSQMFLEGRALSADALYDFADALGTNSQINSAEITQTRIGKWNSQELLKFSISCSLVSLAKTPPGTDADYNNSGLDPDRLFTPAEAVKFFGSTKQISEQAGCKARSLLLSPNDEVFEDKTNGRITKKHAALTILGGYQNILKAAEKLQNRPQHVWFDSVSIQENTGMEALECSMGISVYVADGASRKN
jgi:hypothetical protein